MTTYNAPRNLRKKYQAIVNILKNNDDQKVTPIQLQMIRAFLLQAEHDVEHCKIQAGFDDDGRELKHYIRQLKETQHHFSELRLERKQQA